MKVKEIIDAVAAVIQDQDFSRTDLLGYVNQCAGEIASVYSLPGLLVNSTVVTTPGAFSVALPDDFLRSIIHGINLTTGKPLEIIDAVTDFFDAYKTLDKIGSCTAICAYGSELYYQGVCTVPETLRLFYGAAPSTLTENAEPAIIPKHLQYGIFVNYVCAEAFGLIEDGIDGTKVNHNKYTSRFQLALLKLDAFLGVAPEKPVFVRESAFQEEEI